MATTIDAVGVATARRWSRPSARKLADAAAARALRGAGRTPDDVDLLLNAGLYHDRILGEPALAALIQEDIGANPEDPYAGGHGTFSLDIANGSCGMLTGLQVADGFLRAGTIRHALVVASDADPGRRMAPGFPYAPVGAAIACSWRPGPGGIVGFRVATHPQAATGDGGLRATVRFTGGRNTLVIEEASAFAATAGAWAADVAAKLLADHGMAPGDLDLVVANPLEPAFLDALAGGLDVAPDRLARPASGRRAHTAALGVALAPVVAERRHVGATVLLVSAGAGPVAVAALLAP
jgi:3-oxoacyl-[acyl-carrier-protein] synthase III